MVANTRKSKILVVDDDRVTRNYVASILTNNKWDVDTAKDGPSALSLVRDHKYDVIVLDFRMPGMDGAELCRRIRKYQPNVYSVFMTGFTNINTVYPAMAAGGERVLSKPVDPSELIHVIEEQLGSTEQ